MYQGNYFSEEDTYMIRKNKQNSIRLLMLFIRFHPQFFLNGKTFVLIAGL